jgi:hypothetical protein
MSHELGGIDRTKLHRIRIEIRLELAESSVACRDGPAPQRVDGGLGQGGADRFWSIRSPGNWFRLEQIDLEFVVAMDALA